MDLAPVRDDPPPLRAVRRAHGWSLDYVATAAGIDPAHLSRVERGQARLSIDALARVARVLGLTELAAFLAPYEKGRS